MSKYLEGVADLHSKLKELASPKQQASALRESVSKPMKTVKLKALAALSKISPGKKDIHRTYRGRLVGAGFAARSLKVVVKLSKTKQAAYAMLGVAREAFYVVQFHELGTAFLAKNPWLVPSFESSQSLMLQGVGETMKARIEKIAKKRAAGGK